jgi:predicted negative regulator of RcsB-dependent stress response
VSVHLSEEEQLEAMKRWWKEYGKTIVGAVVVAVVGYFGYSAWQDHQREKAEKASASYEQLVKLATPEAGKILSDADKATITHLAGELKKDSGRNLYGQTAAFFLAKMAVDENNLDKAIEELKWVLAAKPEPVTEQLARLRLARVFFAKKDYTSALAQLAVEPAAAYVSEYAETRGDIYKQQGDIAAARTAYEKAFAGTTQEQQERYMLLQMKLDDLKTEAIAPASVVEEKK